MLDELIDVINNLPEKKFKGLEMYRNQDKDYEAHEFTLAAKEFQDYRQSISRILMLLKQIQPSPLPTGIEDFLL